MASDKFNEIKEINETNTEKLTMDTIINGANMNVFSDFQRREIILFITAQLEFRSITKASMDFANNVRAITVAKNPEVLLEMRNDVEIAHNRAVETRRHVMSLLYTMSIEQLNEAAQIMKKLSENIRVA